MGEQARKIGEKLEGFGEKLFRGFGWNELGRDIEIKCERKSSHDKKTHGLDLLMNFDNPYLGRKQGIIIECKNRKMQSITLSEINHWVSELINSIECASSAIELDKIELGDCNLCTGLLLIHANDQFDKKKFYGYLKSINIKSRRSAINIFIAGNDMIDKWNSLLNKLQNDYNDGFKFIYPSIEGSNMKEGNFITINQLYSKYIFAQDYVQVDCINDGKSYKMPKKRKILISFDEISINSFKYIWSMFKYYQLQDAAELVFIFYPQTKDDASFIKNNFISTLSKIQHPIDEDIRQKIKIDYIDNRNLSPVDIGRI